MAAAKKTRSTRKALSGDILGVTTYQTRSRGPGVRVFYKAKTLVRTAKSVVIEEEILSAGVDCCDDAAVDPELRLAIRTLAGVSDSFVIVVNHLLRQLDPTLKRK